MPEERVPPLRAEGDEQGVELVRCQVKGLPPSVEVLAATALRWIAGDRLRNRCDGAPGGGAVGANMGRIRRHKSQEDVELNLAAMLDMAFQLLTFFILTFKPAPIEGQINLRLPPPIGITKEGTEDPGKDISTTSTPRGMNTLVISVFAKEGGEIAAMGVGESPVNTLPGLDSKLQQVFSDKATPFDQIIIQVGGKLRYDELMKVVEVCTHQTLPDGTKLAKLSFVEVPDQPSRRSGNPRCGSLLGPGDGWTSGAGMARTRRPARSGAIPCGLPEIAFPDCSAARNGCV